MDNSQYHEQSVRAEAFLFVEGGSLTRKKLASLVGVPERDLAPILQELGSRLHGRGLSLIASTTEVSLVVSPEASAAVKAASQQELEKEVGDAGLEVLSIILYRGPSTRAQIDYIRGVNTSSTIRTLLMRGLIERTGNPDDAREYVYRPTIDLLAHLGVRSVEELPDHDKIHAELAAFEAIQQRTVQHPGDPEETV